MKITIATIKDLPSIQQLFVETIKNTCIKDYNAAQIKVWTAGVKNTQRWLQAIANQYFILAKVDEKILGFASLENGNYIDFLFVHHQAQHSGIAKKLITKLYSEAERLNQKTIKAHVSITAKPFFENQGFIVLSQNIKKIDNLEIINFTMSLNLTSV